MKVIKSILGVLWKAITGKKSGGKQVAEEVGYPHRDSIEELLPLVQGEDSDTQYTLGSMYHDGKGGPQDFQQAFKWYERAAEQGNADAQYCLGMMYDEGKGVPQDYQEALKWIRRAAEQGDSRSQFLLGVNYESGDRDPNDYVLAYKWYNLAAEQGDEDCIEQRKIIAKKMTSSQIEKAQRLTREFKPKKEKP